MGIIELRAQVRAAASDRKITTEESSALQAAGLTADQVAGIRANAKDGGGLSDGELMTLVHSSNTTVAGEPVVAAAAAATPRAAAAGATDAARGATSTRSLDRGAGVYRVNAETVYLRTHSGNGLARGMLTKGDRFEVHEVRNGYAYGYAPEQKKWGWMRLASAQTAPGGGGIEGTARANIHEVQAKLPAGTKRHEARQLNGNITYASAADKRRYGLDGYTYDATPRVPTAKLYGNVVDGQGADPIATDFAKYERVGVRYAYDKDWYVVLAKDEAGASRWGFMRRDELMESPDPAYRSWLRDHPDFRA